MTCRRTQEFLAKHRVDLPPPVDARKSPLRGDAALAAVEGAATLIVVKGKRVDRVSLGQERPSERELLSLLLGPTGNLRAPTIRVGRTVVVGFDAPTYRSVLGLAG